MRRDIVFRGKSVDTGEWVYGYYVKGVTRHCIFQSIGGLRCDVLPETVGQYTGVLDNIGTPIYEGDIVEVYGIGKKEIVFHNGGFCFKVQKAHIAFMQTDAYRFEYCGNIHDDPKLLDGRRSDNG